MQYPEAGPWTFLTIVRYNSWQDFATDDMNNVTQSNKNQGEWFEFSSLQCFAHRYRDEQYRAIMVELSRKILFLVIVTCGLLTSCRRGPGPADTIRNAYGWYVRELKSGINPLEQKRAELKQFVTDDFLVSLDNMRSELEAGPFVDAQSFDAKLSIEKITSDRATARVRVGLTSRLFGQRAVYVYLVKVDGTWKVDDVKLVEQVSLGPSSGGDRKIT
jgi:hypothetical protein